MEGKNKERITIAFFFGIIGIVLGVVSEKWGIARGKVPDTISWGEFFSERIDNVLITALLCFGVGYILSFWLRDNSKYLICPSCQTPYKSSDIKNCTCPKCLVKLEPVEGFYDRPPEYKENKNES